jgi:hypothetical protein
VKALALLVVLTVTTSAAPDRAGYVARALTAVKQLGAVRDALDAKIYTAVRTDCHADNAAPTIECLIDAARAQCAGDAPCVAAADVIVTNLRSADAFVDEVTRVQLLRSSADYRVALAAELRRRYAVLAAELVLAGGNDEARAIDELCAKRDIAIHVCELGATDCIPSLPYARCVAALVWYVGGAP